MADIQILGGSKPRVLLVSSVIRPRTAVTLIRAITLIRAVTKHGMPFRRAADIPTQAGTGVMAS